MILGPSAHSPTVVKALGEIRDSLHGRMPHAFCRNCGGSGCEKCEDRGWFNQTAFRRLPKSEQVAQEPDESEEQFETEEQAEETTEE